MDVSVSNQDKRRAIGVVLGVAQDIWRPAAPKDPNLVVLYQIDWSKTQKHTISGPEQSPVKNGTDMRLSDRQKSFSSIIKAAVDHDAVKHRLAEADIALVSSRKPTRALVATSLDHGFCELISEKLAGS